MQNRIKKLVAVLRIPLMALNFSGNRFISSNSKNFSGWKWGDEFKGWYRRRSLREISKEQGESKPFFVDEEKDMVIYMPIYEMKTVEVRHFRKEAEGVDLEKFSLFHSSVKIISKEIPDETANVSEERNKVTTEKSLKGR